MYRPCFEASSLHRLQSSGPCALSTKASQHKEGSDRYWYLVSGQENPNGEKWVSRTRETRPTVMVSQFSGAHEGLSLEADRFGSDSPAGLNKICPHENRRFEAESDESK